MYQLSFTAEDLEKLFAKQNLDIISDVKLSGFNIIVNVDFNITNGSELKFKTPADSSEVSTLVVNYKDASGDMSYRAFGFVDAHGNDIGDIDHLFAKNALVKVILDVSSGRAFVQNADTNAYLEGRFTDLESLISESTDTGAVRFDHDQSLTEHEQMQARKNIGLSNINSTSALIPTVNAERLNLRGTYAEKVWRDAGKNDTLLPTLTFGQDDTPDNKVRLHGIADPVEDCDAATKQYVDEVITQAIANIATYNGETKNIITFKVVGVAAGDGHNYQADEGMTWGEWLISEYNPVGTDWELHEENGYLYDTEGYFLCNADGDSTHVAEVILPDQPYYAV